MDFQKDKSAKVCHLLIALFEHTGCSLNIVFFLKNFVIFLNSVSSAAALVRAHTLTPQFENTEKGKSPEYFKNTIFNEPPVAHFCVC